ncbi:FtsX-like permease family protein [Nocardioides daeguensis]|uniref:ABC3 transporter permease C-terminal domain-containing protein n=1 Tax=Nocardioides daeguensis TaxID=908359 RepID=A0ABP6W2N4_9ACTN|nr:ABC transporter permease [Nocardioides daeguensis]MBV6727631.1 ABC transporter permease [Nocardioides daeguensis]MCR1775103.1 ABC transporter permease [Nocardioides daeguensis]
MSVWKPAQRMARRSIRRNLARSVLIALLIGLPVAVATFSDVLYRSTNSPVAYAHQRLGSADAKLVVTPAERIDDFQLISEWNGGYDSVGERDPATVDVERLLPPGTRVEVASATDGGAFLLLRKGERYAESSLSEATMPSAFQPDRIQLRGGTYPGPGEVAIAQGAADKLGVGPGDVVTDDLTGTEITISGIVRDEQCLRCTDVYAQPGQDIVPRPPAAGPDDHTQTYLVDLPPGVSAKALAHQLAEQGVVLYPRDTYVHRDKYQAWDETLTLDQVRGAALTTLIVGLGLLEVILLAGAAFAVGARKQVRDMGLISAGGASPRQLRAVLLVQGATLGVLGTVGGVVVGVLVARLGWPLWEWLNGSALPVFRIGPEVLIAVVVGVLSGVLAAVVPAVGAARRQPLDALSGRFRTTREHSRRATVLGGLGIGGGIVLGLAGSSLMAGDFADYSEALATARLTGVSLQAPSPTVPIALVLTGALLGVAGLVLAMPSLLGLLGRVGARLPLPGRLAVRDADRHRHRTGPATSAIMLAVAGSVVAAFAATGSARAEEARWLPDLPENTMRVYAQYGNDQAENAAITSAAVERAAAVLPDAQVLAPSELGYAVPASEQEQGMAPIQSIWFDDHVGCDSSCVSYGSTGTAAIADPALVRLTLGRDLTAAEQAALDRGEVLVTSPSMIDADGNVTASLYDEDEAISEEDIAKLALPALAASRKTFYTSMPGVFMSAETAAANGLVLNPEATRLIAYASDATPAQEKAGLRAAGEGHRAAASIGEPYHDDYRVVLLVVGGVAALATLIGVAIAVALSAAEGRRELATLSAVGADPAVRRRLAGAQALVISGVGALVGVVLGSFVSYALRATFGAPSFTVPWANLAGVGLGVPVLAALITAACTRSTVPMLERRA